MRVEKFYNYRKIYSGILIEKMKRYFAHAVNAYNTPLEQAAIKLIEKTFPGDTIENPNQPHHQEGYTKWAQRQRESDTAHRGMSYFYDEVLPQCEGTVAMPFLDGRMGLGVAGETKVTYKEGGKQIWFMCPTPLPDSPKELLLRLGEFILNPQSGLFTIRPFMEEELEMLLREDTRLVVPHIETRLRTWKLYNLVFLPYEEAHLVGITPTDYFYLKELLAKKP